MIHFSLFSGIGGFEIASEWAGWNNYLSCDINEFGNKILNYYWPEAYHHKDIHTLNHQVINDELTKRYGTDWRADDIILTGGFPCQPYSSAGKRLGKEDDRHLWPEMLRVIREIKPTWVVGENVLGLVNWNDGLVFNEVQADLEAEGYEVQAFVLPAASVNAPHRRDRVWFVAYSKSQGSRKQQSKNPRWQNRRSNNNGTISNASDTYSWRLEGSTKEGRNCEYVIGTNGITTQTRNATDTSSFGCNDRSDNWEERYISDDERITEKSKSEWQRRECRSCETGATTSNPKSERSRKQQSANQRWEDRRFDNDGTISDASDTNGRRQSCKKHWQKKTRWITEEGISDYWQNFPTQSPVCGGDDGLPTELDGITFPKWRNESIKAYGNAIVPQVAYQIFKAINEYKEIYE
jgi:DNA (cytosine-5)-methyltransferase 1